MSRNRLETVKELDFMRGLEELRWVWVAGNGFAEGVGRRRVAEVCARVVEVDGGRVVRRPVSEERRGFREK